MSTINATTVQATNVQDTAGANSSTTAQLTSGRAKAWCEFNGSGTPATRASFNVASITDVLGGEYDVNFTTDFSSNRYSAIGTVTNSSRANLSISDLATDKFHVNCRETDTGTFTDYGSVSVVAFGDQ